MPSCHFVTNEVALIDALLKTFSTSACYYLNITVSYYYSNKESISIINIHGRFVIPHGFSVNDSIDPDQFSLQYIKFDDVVAMVAKLGRGALMAKIDVQSAYRNVAVLPSQRYLLGKFYVDLVLPFGLRSAPFIFNSIADLVEWILHNNYMIRDLLHYLDDYITTDPPCRPDCARNLVVASSVCQSLGLPLHRTKPWVQQRAWSFWVLILILCYKSRSSSRHQITSSQGSSRGMEREEVVYARTIGITDRQTPSCLPRCLARSYVPPSDD